MHRVRLLNKEVTFDVAQDGTILEAALNSGVNYPFGCSAGSCGACKSRLIDGAVDMMDYSPLALTESERSAGLILACRAKPRGDCLIVYDDDPEAPNHAIRRVDSRVIAHDRATHDVVILRVAVESGFVFSPGQFATLAPDGVPARDYSMANATNDGTYEFHIRRMPGGRTSSFIHDCVRIGDRLSIRGPFGTAYLRAKHNGPTLLVAGGTGLAPIISIAQAALAGLGQAPIHLYFGVRAERDLYMTEFLDELARKNARFRWNAVLSDPEGASARKLGYVGSVAARELADLTGYKVYAAGPPVMVDATRAEVLARGALDGDFHADPFHTAADAARAAQAP
jgi:ferredoxin-NAD(P)+ reductase (naphthalene dioxygenase ferredoxin-specific)